MAMRTGRQRPTSPSSQASHHATAGSRWACPSVNTGRSTFASATYRTCPCHFSFYRRFGIQAFDLVRAQCAQRRVGRELDRRVLHPATTFFQWVFHFASEGLDDELAQGRPTFDSGDFCFAEYLVREIQSRAHKYGLLY